MDTREQTQTEVLEEAETLTAASSDERGDNLNLNLNVARPKREGRQGESACRWGHDVNAPHDGFWISGDAGHASGSIQVRYVDPGAFGGYHH
jgi:hypothetical protein